MAENRFELAEPSLDDDYDIDVYNRNIRNIAANALKSTSASELRVMTQEAYDALTEKSSTVLYLVKGASDFTLYLGEMPLQKGSGSAVSNTSLTTHTLTGTAVTASYKEVSE